MTISLTSDQAQAIERIVAWSKTDAPFFTLAGSAGVGKTTCMGALIRELGVFKVALAAPTNKAAAVLRSVAPEAACFTIFSAAGLTLVDDAERKYVARRHDGAANNYRIIVVDEASMVGNKLLSACHDHHDQFGTKFLFLGDPLQLPPVSDGKHAVFNFPKFVLTQVVRQAQDNPIVRYAVSLRRAIAYGGPDPKPPPPNGNGVHVQRGEWRPGLLERVGTGGDRRAIAWRNRTVDDLATAVREKLYGKNPPRFVVGERVFTAKPLEQLWTDAEATVEAIGSECNHPNYPELRALPITLRSDDGTPVMAFAVAQSSIGELAKRKEGLHKAAVRLQQSCNNKWHPAVREAWKAYHRLCGAFCDLRSVHAITAHRSQGSTFDEVHVDAKDLASCRDREFRLRLLYVACTRARTNVYLRAAA